MTDVRSVAPRTSAVAGAGALTVRSTGARRPLATRRAVVLPLIGFAATFAFMSASLINPLSGASAATVPAADAAAVATSAVAVAGQSYTVSVGTAPSASRDAYTVNYTAPVVVKPVTVTKSTTTTSTSTTTSSAATTATAPAAAAPTAGSAQAIGAAQVAAHGWGTDQFNCLVSLWNRESGWNVYASNASGAYGIPQALPGSKMASFGADWQTSASTQIAWGLSYIVGRYTTPCGAWAHSEAYNWY